jgi:hypothetical protein
VDYKYLTSHRLKKNDNNLEQNLNLTQTLDEEKFKLAISTSKALGRCLGGQQVTMSELNIY